MFNRRLTRWILLAIVLSTLLCAVPAASAAETDEMLQMLKEYPLESYSYVYSTGSSRTAATTYYSPALLFQDSSILSPDLVKTSMALSVAAYDANHAKNLLSSMGFQPEDNTAVYERSKNGLTVTDCDYVAYTIAKQQINHPITDEPYILYCVPIQGTPMNLEWLSDFNLGDGIEHEGFRRCATEVSLELIKAFSDDGYDADHRILWLTGHSRGAACANLIAGWFSTGEYTYVASENLFTYTFACPAVSKKAITTLPNIFNFNNPGDLVPMLPLPEWGYGRYGQTFELDTTTMCYGNVTQRYASVTGGEYVGKLGGEDYRAILSELGKTDLLQTGLSLMGWTLSGANISDLGEYLEKDSEYDFISRLKDALALIPEGSGPIKIIELMELLVGDDDQNSTLINWSISAYEDAKNLDMNLPEDVKRFQDFLAINDETIIQLESVSGVTITVPSDLQEAHSRLIDDSHNIVRLVNCLCSVRSLIVDDNGNIADKVLQAHTQPVYVIWINSMFYGSHGWQDNPLIDDLTLKDSYTSLSKRTYPCEYYSIGDYCFGNCDIPTTADIPDSVVSIGSYSFRDCDGLTDVSFPDSLVSIGVCAFVDCNYLTAAVLPDSTTTIGASAFRDCWRLATVTIPDSVTSLGNSAFSQCRNMKTLTMPADLSNVPAFYLVGSLKTIHYTKGTTGIMPDRPRLDHSIVADFNNNPELWSCNTLEEIIFDEGIVHIAANLFQKRSGWMNTDPLPGPYSLDNLVSVTLPSTLESIGEFAFMDCYKAVFNEWPENLTTIGKGTFYNCRKITSVPRTLTDIPDNAFYYCAGLKEIILSDAVTRIGKRAFNHTNLDSKLTVVTIPDSVTEIGEEAFLGCNVYGTLTLPADLDYGDAFSYAYAVNVHFTPGRTGVMPDLTPEDTDHPGRNVSEDLIFDDGITHIGAYLCTDGSTSDWNSASRVVFPSTLKTIGDYAFNQCYRAEFSPMPESVTSIGSYAFRGCDKLSTLTFTADAPAIGTDAFGEVVSTMYYPMDNPTWTEDLLQNYGGTLTWLPNPCNGDHIEVIDEAVPATCSKTGLTEGSHCGSCGEVLKVQEVVPTNDVHLNILKLEGVAPTCVAMGVTEGSYCGDCGLTLVMRENIPATGIHVSEKKWEAVPATCVTPGLTEGSYCGDCGEVLKAQEVVPVNDVHLSVLKWEAVEPTCGEPGMTEGSYCGDCGTTLMEQQEIPATGIHSYGRPEFRWSSDGYCDTLWTCEDCSWVAYADCRITSETIQPTEMKYGSITYTAVAELDGQSYTDTYTVILPATGHVEHRPGESWFADESYHWHQCVGCGEIMDHETHMAQDPDAGVQICSVCGSVMGVPSGVSWFMRTARNGSDNYLWASGTYRKLMGRFGNLLP